MRLPLAERQVFRALQVIEILYWCFQHPQRLQNQTAEIHYLRPLLFSSPSTCRETRNQRNPRRRVYSAYSFHPFIGQVGGDVSNEDCVQLVLSSRCGSRTLHFLDKSRSGNGRCRHGTGIGGRYGCCARERLAKVYNGSVEIEVWRDQGRILVAARCREAWRKAWRRAIPERWWIHRSRSLPVALQRRLRQFWFTPYGRRANPVNMYVN